MSESSTTNYERRFTAVKGVQAGREYYLANCPFYLLPELFNDLENSSIPPLERAQRTINKSRAGAIKKYLLENPENYVFSAATVSIDGEVHFEPSDKNSTFGTLVVKDRAQYIINDGQHRIFAIIDALKEDRNIEYEYLPIIFFNDPNLNLSQQIFTDLNRYTLKPAQSLSILYDSRDPLAEIARKLSGEVSYFSGSTEYEKSTISNRSTNMFTLNGLYNATKMLLTHSSKTHEAQLDFACKFWEMLGDNLPEWQQCRDGKMPSAMLRQDYLTGHNFFLQLAGTITSTGLEAGIDLKKLIGSISSFDWRRDNPRWQDRALHNGKITKSNISLLLTANVLKQQLKLPLSEREKQAELEFTSAHQG